MGSTVARARPTLPSHALAPSKWRQPSFQSLHRLLFHYFGNDGFVSKNLANSTSLLFVSTSVYSGAKFSLSKMKKGEQCLLVTPLSILCIYKKRSELFYNQRVRIHTKGYMQKTNRLLRDHSLPHTVSLICIPTLDSS